MSYVIYFDIEGSQYRLPVNPEEVELSQGQDHSEYDVLVLGKVSVPGNLSLKEISFECEFPSKPYGYITTKNEFYPAEFYLNLFEKCRLSKKPIRFVSYNGYNSISELVTIEDFSWIESAGEEGDYKASFNLKQYKPYSMKEVTLSKPGTISPTAPSSPIRSGEPPKPQNKIHVVTKGDTLWSIAKRYLGNGDRYKEIHQLNQPPLGKNPNVVTIGQKLVIPSK